MSFFITMPIGVWAVVATKRAEAPKNSAIALSNGAGRGLCTKHSWNVCGSSKAEKQEARVLRLIPNSNVM